MHSLKKAVNNFVTPQQFRALKHKQASLQFRALKHKQARLQFRLFFRFPPYTLPT